MDWVSLECVECCFLQVGVPEIAGSRRVHSDGAANKWAECQEFVIRTGHAPSLCWRREAVTFSRFTSRADVCAANSLAESQGFLGRSVRAANMDGAACCYL